MALIIDFLLLAASGGACFYCWVLSSRLKALTSNKDGLQTGVAALSNSAEDMQRAIKKMQEHASESSTGLEQLLGESREKISQLQALLAQSDRISRAPAQDDPAVSVLKCPKFVVGNWPDGESAKGEAA